MQPTAAPWSKGAAASVGSPLPAIARGETTTAPWATSFTTPSSGHAAARLQAELQAEPRFPRAIDLSAHQFQPAEKRITGLQKLEQFLKSAAAKDFVNFLLALN
jgi:uncharacterized protein (DUF1501 family)